MGPFKRVVVTGLGAVTPLGLDLASTWEALLAGRSGVDRITLFDPEGFETQIAGEVKGFDPLKRLDRKEARRMDRFVQLVVCASLEAIESARLRIDASNAEDIGVIIGSGIGGLITLSEQYRVLTEKGPSRVSPFLIPMMIADMGAGQVSIATGAKGTNYCTTSACASAAHAIGESFEAIRRGDVKAVITGGAEACITPIGIAGFNSARALSTFNAEPQRASRPFDRDRDGFVMGEGGASLILEELEFAQERGARILAEMVGYGSTGDAFHITAPSEGGEGGVRAMRMALRKAGLEPNEVDYINAHGTGTPMNDKYETMAIKTLFGDHARKLAINSTKSMIGHLIGAAAAVEAVVTVLAIHSGVLHPTINLDNPDPDCDLDYVPNVARRAEVRVGLSNSLGFGGHNTALVFRRYE
ncbi:MAG: beta-ketoacyl-[acyl-carrier-protein] synthase II [Chloroflexota bacterium]|nr:MAG: beta-ketoacyl-[acyl-carrier-protein] synthase II [Chloroflexota bacterium]